MFGQCWKARALGVSARGPEARGQQGGQVDLRGVSWGVRTLGGWVSAGWPWRRSPGAGAGHPWCLGGARGDGAIPATVGDVSLVTATISVVRPWGPQSVKALAGWRIATLSWECPEEVKWVDGEFVLGRTGERSVQKTRELCPPEEAASVTAGQWPVHEGLEPN